MTDESNDGPLIAQRVLQQLESLHRAGVTSLARFTGSTSLPPIQAPPDASSPNETPTRSPRQTASLQSAAPPDSGPLMSTEVESPAPSELREEPAMPAGKRPKSLKAKQSALAVLQEEVRSCVRCPELASQRTQTVFGVGDPQARLCFFGEAPGADEDREGEPFVGKAGQLLNKIIEACTLRREDVYILNTLRCRPPGNRNPLPEEVANCRPFFEKQLEIIQPEFICCLGAVAAQALLETKVAVGKLRGHFHDYGEAKVIVTYHPAYLLRNPSMKRETWEDMKILMKAMGITLPEKQG